MLAIFVERECDRIPKLEGLRVVPKEVVDVRFRFDLVDVVEFVEVLLFPDVHNGAALPGASHTRNQKEQQGGSEHGRGFHRPMLRTTRGQRGKFLFLSATPDSWAGIGLILQHLAQHQISDHADVLAGIPASGETTACAPYAGLAILSTIPGRIHSLGMSYSTERPIHCRRPVLPPCPRERSL
jgi:hypothetical protein